MNGPVVFLCPMNFRLQLLPFIPPPPPPPPPPLCSRPDSLGSLRAPREFIARPLAVLVLELLRNPFSSTDLI
jgi:hypothetical protein